MPTSIVSVILYIGYLLASIFHFIVFKFLVCVLAIVEYVCFELYILYVCICLSLLVVCIWSNLIFFVFL